MHVSFRQLRLFLALVDHGSVSAAARASHVTQPTASMQLKELAERVGVPLFEVVARKVRLTDAGQRLAATARSMLDSWEAFAQEMDAFRGLERGTLRVAVVSTAKYFMPRLLGDFCRHHPGIDVALQVLNRDGVVQRLRENRDDLYIMSMPPRDLELVDVVFKDNPLVLIAPTRDPLAKQRQCTTPSLAARRFILREVGSGTRMAVDRHFRRLRFRPDVRLELGSNEAIKEAVAGGLGLGVISLHALHGRRREHGVAVVDARDFPIASHWHVVHPAGKRLSPAAAAFREGLLGDARA